ncbi:MAG: CDP-glycerol glycerophosphotransferase family protein [Cetobacterium sp.]|uniref:CDP-glycerol glycerophosphotransferase family protein n=1 Tax=Cetobacterium sp. TaxID=2071632 RepID=UPI003F39C454
MKRRVEKLKSTLFQTYLSTLAKIEYFFNKKKLKGKEIWIISETENQAQDNGYYFFKYMREKFPEKNVYYIIDRNAPRISELEKIGNILYLGEYKTILYLLSAKYILSTHGLWMLPNELGITKKITKKVISGKKIWLCHGITAMKNGSATYHKKNFALNDFVVAASKFERDVFTTHYGYLKEEILLTGFPRYDDMASEIKEKIILLMPTWRDNQDNLEEKFLNTEFYLKIKSLLENRDLQGFLEEKNIKLYLYLHENFQKYNKYFFNFENKKISIIKNKEKNVKELLKISSCLISDYSSVIFDYAYMNKPVISYQFDYESYINSRKEKPFIDITSEIPALVTRKEDDIIEFLKRIEKNNFEFIEKERKCLDKFFEYTDNKNCERLYTEIINLK